MKYFLKSFIIFALILCFAGSASARVSEYDLYNYYCPKKPYDIANGFNRGVQSMTGLNLIASQIAKGEIKKSLNTFAKGKIDVKVRSYCASDAKNGKFKSFYIHGQNVLLNNTVYISDIYAKTMCDFISLDLNSNPIKLREPMALDFGVKFSETDLNKLLNTSSYKKYFFKAKVNSEELHLMEISNPKISLAGNKFRFSVGVKVPFIGTVVPTVVTDLKVVNNKIKIANASMGTAHNMVDIGNAKQIVEVFNPFSFIQLALRFNGCQMLLKNVKIQDNMIVIDGAFFMSRS